MSFDLLTFNNSSNFYSSSDFASPPQHDLQFFSHDFSEYSINDSIYQNPDDENFHFLNQTAPYFHTQSSSSPPSHQMGNLSLQFLTNCSKFPNGFVNFSGFNMNKAVNMRLDSLSSYNNNSTISPQNVAKISQRSNSSKSFHGESRMFSQPQLDSVIKSPNCQYHFENSPEKSVFSAQIRRVHSTGDLLGKNRASQSANISFMEKSLIDETNFKVGKYSADERREIIHKYRAKRSQRNFNKTIKYACRKALADNRPRVRGRFVRSDEIGGTPNTAILIKDEDDEDLFWVDESQGEDYEGTVGGGELFNNFEPTILFQYHGHC